MNEEQRNEQQPATDVTAPDRIIITDPSRQTTTVAPTGTEATGPHLVITDSADTQVPKEVFDQAKRLARQELQLEFDQSLKKKFQELEEQNKMAISEAIDQWKKKQEPPTPQDIQKLLEGDAPEFKVSLKVNGESQVFTIHELPARVEKQFLRMLREELMQHMGLIAGLTVDLLKGQADDKLKTVLQAIEPVTGVISKTTSLILTNSQENGSGKEITPEQVDGSLSLTKQLQLLTAQVEANRVRDFFSYAFRLRGL